mmetsp:Transcript_44878/g.51577  ORF Transcript_44878/g.51577 Transcript_44878/m.51577 type:complete len:91 (-) Transcript_44878:470-742(-)
MKICLIFLFFDFGGNGFLSFLSQTKEIIVSVCVFYFQDTFLCCSDRLKKSNSLIGSKNKAVEGNWLLLSLQAQRAKHRTAQKRISNSAIC